MPYGWSPADNPYAEARGDVEIAVWSELDSPPVVIDVGLIERQQQSTTVPIGHVRVVRRDMELHDEGVAIGVKIGEVDVEAAVVRIVRVEGQPEHSLFQVVALDQHAQVEEWVWQEIAILINDPDEAGALNDEEAATAVVGSRDVDRVGQALGDFDQLDGRVARERATGLDGASARPAALSLIEGWR